MDIDSYLIGIFDGEGSISPYLIRDRLRIMVSVTMCSRDPVFMFYEKFGGMFSDGKHKTITHTPKYIWQIVNGSSVPVLEFLSKNCIVKKRQADLALIVARSMAGNNCRPLTVEEKQKRLSIALEIRSLNKHITDTPSIEDGDKVAKYLLPKRTTAIPVEIIGVGRFSSHAEAAKHLGVAKSLVQWAASTGGRALGYKIERLNVN